MHKHTTCWAFLLVLSFGSWALTKPAVSPPAPQEGDNQRIEELIKHLGSSKFQERNTAQKELEAIGAPALEKLKKAVKTEDLETSKRAAELVRKIEERALTSNLLAPRRVHLKVKDLPVLDAVAELAKLSGYPVQVQGDRTKLADKKITLDTGDVTFWEALDQLCARAGLVEKTPTVPNIGSNTGVRPIRINVRPLPAPVVPKKALPAPAPKEEEKKPEAKEKVPPGAAKTAPAEAKAQEAKAQAAKEAARAEAARAEAALLAVLAQMQQAQQVQAQAQLQGLVRVPGGANQSGGNIILLPGTPKKKHVSYAGSVRLQVTPQAKPPAGEYLLKLEAAAEPRLQGFVLVGQPSIERAVDDQGQKLLVNPAPLPPNLQNPAPQVGFGGGGGILGSTAYQANPRQQMVRLKTGTKPAKKLKELSGTVTAQVFSAPEALVTLPNVLKAAGETAKGKSGGLVRLNSIAKQPNGDYRLQIYMEVPPGQNPMGIMVGNGMVQIQQVQVQVGGLIGNQGLGGNSGLPELQDAKGNKYQVVSIPSRRMSFNNGVSTQEFTIHYRASNNQGDPDRLVLHGTRPVHVTIPFSFQDVGLE